MTGVDKLELPQFSIVELRLVSREVRFTTGMDESLACKMGLIPALNPWPEQTVTENNAGNKNY